MESEFFAGEGVVRGHHECPQENLDPKSWTNAYHISWR